MQCDIIIPIWNQPEFTKDCIESIRANTGSRYRLILIDNASDDETRDYLRNLQSVLGQSLCLIRNEENVGFIKAVNQGIRLAVAPYVCLLNNDTIVYEGWLEELLGVISKDKKIGIVNPSSNNLGQRPGKGEPFGHYAAKIRKTESGKFVELGSAIGFCMLVRKYLFSEIGLFDEIYGMGNFEDTDFSRRAVKEGYRLVRACGAYVYHRENSSFKKLKSYDADFRRNRQIYESRWGRPMRVAYLLDEADRNIPATLSESALMMAREGSRIWFYSTKVAGMPEHGNIIKVELPNAFPYVATVFKILTKKKKFDDLYVKSDRYARLLGWLRFIHKARVVRY